MAQMKIDFRKEIDPWCKYDPKILACDGTHVGLSLRHLNLQNPYHKDRLQGRNNTTSQKVSTALYSRSHILELMNNYLSCSTNIIFLNLIS